MSIRPSRPTGRDSERGGRVSCKSSFAKRFCRILVVKRQQVEQLPLGGNVPFLVVLSEHGLGEGRAPLVKILSGHGCLLLGVKAADHGNQRDAPLLEVFGKV